MAGPTGEAGAPGGRFNFARQAKRCGKKGGKNCVRKSKRH